jgi:hypothetical protein
MLPELLAWFTGKEQNRRKFPRKRKPYRAAYTLDDKSARPAIGLDISGGGLCILTQEPVRRDECDVRVELDDRSVRMRAKVVWHDNVQHQGRKVWRYGLRFVGIAADDWDAVMRYTTDRPVTETNKAQEELSAVRMTPDDAARLLPRELQTRLLQMLVDRGRLAQLSDRVPLVQYFYSGIVRHDDRLVHRLVIQSKVVGPERDELYETRFVFDESGKNVQILN